MKRKIKDLPQNERPIEKLISLGVNSLSDSELLAILLRTGTKQQSAIELAYEMIENTDQGILDFVDMSVDEFCNTKGIGNSKACQIIASIELGKRISKERLKDKVKIGKPSDVSDLFIEEFKYLSVEKLAAVYLNSKNEIIHWEVIFTGSLNHSIVHPREIFKKGVKLSAAGIIIVHNHPSGDVSPSKEDEGVTKRVAEAGKIVGIPLLDHIVVGYDRYYSFRENGDI